MYFTREAFAVNRQVMSQHWGTLWANRNQFNIAHDDMINRYRPAMSPEHLVCNAVGGLSRDFWAEIDRQVIQLRDQEVGMEIVNDLMAVMTPLPIGKTAKVYSLVGDIEDDVAVSIDGQAPYGFDHTDYKSDGDPIPVFTAGYGVNWRHAAGLSTVGIDLVRDSGTAKMRKYNKRIVSYILRGDPSIQVESYPAQGLTNHRNTVKIDLGAGGANIDLTTATSTQIIAFFTSGAFGQTARDNFVAAYDVLWVSPQIMANLMQPNLIELGSGGQTTVAGTTLDAVMKFIPATSVRQSFALSGNEFIAYQRRSDIVSPLVGMTTGVVPLPRLMPQANYNFQIMGAMGLQVSRDADGRSGVVYGADLS